MKLFKVTLPFRNRYAHFSYQIPKYFSTMALLSYHNQCAVVSHVEYHSIPTLTDGLLVGAPFPFSPAKHPHCTGCDYEVNYES